MVMIMAHLRFPRPWATVYYFRAAATHSDLVCLLAPACAVHLCLARRFRLLSPTLRYPGADVLITWILHLCCYLQTLHIELHLNLLQPFVLLLPELIPPLRCIGEMKDSSE